MALHRARLANPSATATTFRGTSFARVLRGSSRVAPVVRRRRRSPVERRRRRSCSRAGSKWPARRPRRHVHPLPPPASHHLCQRSAVHSALRGRASRRQISGHGLAGAARRSEGCRRSPLQPTAHACLRERRSCKRPATARRRSRHRYRCKLDWRERSQQGGRQRAERAWRVSSQHHRSALPC